MRINMLFRLNVEIYLDSAMFMYKFSFTKPHVTKLSVASQLGEKRRLSVTHLSLENYLSMVQLMLSPCMMMTGAFNRNINKLFPELKLVTDNLLFTHETNVE